MNMSIKIIHVGWMVFCLGLVNSDLPASPCDTNVYVEVGKQGIVPCRFQDFQILGWINGDGSYGETSPFIYFENSVKKGRGYDSGDYDILPDGSLIINNVQLKHEFNFTVSYTPNVGRRMAFFVPVSVYDFPIVNGEANQEHLVLQLNREDELTCSLDRVLQGASLEWVILSPKDEVALESEITEINNGDGTSNITLNSRFIMIGPSIRHVVLQCLVSRQAGYVYPDVTTFVLLSDSFPVVNGLARQQHLVLYLKRQDELNCSMYRVSKGVSLEWIIVNSELSSEITFKDEFTEDDNGDGTFNVTLKSSFNVMSSSIQYVTFQCRVSGRRANLYPDVTTVDILFSESTSSDSISRWPFTLDTLILFIGLVAIFVVLVLMLLKISKKHTVKVPENPADTVVLGDRGDYKAIKQDPDVPSDQQSQDQGWNL